jgi:ADP-ribose pyrophosphatase YjhB (NUDIX family)
MDIAKQLLAWADKLRDIAAMGSHFARNPYDKEHYLAVQDISVEMLAAATGRQVESFEPVRAAVLSRPTPFVAGDAAVIDKHGYLLLIRRADNSLWAMPGGALEVGETPAQGVVRETLEETGVACSPTALVGVFDSRISGTQSAHHIYHFLFLCTPSNGREIPQDRPSHAQEVLEAGWFREQDLPQDLDPGHAYRIPHAYRVWRQDTQAYFDN